MLDAMMVQRAWLRAMQVRAAAIAHRAHLSANAATIAAAIAGTAAGAGFAAGFKAAGLASLWLSAALDALDGTLARQYGGPTAWGGVMDLAADRWVEAAALAGIVWHVPAIAYAALIVAASWYVNIAVFLAAGAALGGGGKLIEYPPGLVERTEAFVFFTLLAIGASWGVWLCYAYALAEILTAVQRLRFARARLLQGR